MNLFLIWTHTGNLFWRFLSIILFCLGLFIIQALAYTGSEIDLAAGAHFSGEAISAVGRPWFLQGEATATIEGKETEMPVGTSQATPEDVETGPTLTPTLIPFPTVTFQYKQFTPTGILMSLEKQPGSTPLLKGKQFSRARLLRWWPLGLLGILWLILAIWFVVAQVTIQAERHREE